TLVPGWNLVPRWRTRMLPGTTASPPNFFTPRRCPPESRPFRELPPAFLWAISRYSLLLLRGGLGGGLRLRRGLLRRRLLGRGLLRGGLLRRGLLGGRLLLALGLLRLRPRRRLGARLRPLAVGQDVGHPKHRDLLAVA